MMRTDKGKIGFIDFERPVIDKNPGSDYSKLVSREWTDPSMMQTIIQKVRAANTDIDGFDIMFRAALVSREGRFLLAKTGGIILQEADQPGTFDDNPQVLADAKAAYPVLKQMIIDAVDGTGPWAEQEA